MGFDFRFLGPLQVWRGGRFIEIRAPKQRALLAVLAIRAGQVVSIDRLIEELWGGAPPPSARTTLYSLVFRLRRRLHAGVEVMGTRSPGYLLRVAPGALDFRRFEAGLVRGRAELAAQDHARAARTFRDALALWRGQAFADVPEIPLLQAEARRLEELRLTALEDRIEADLALGRHALVAAELYALVEEYPLRERLWEMLMLALYRSARQVDALRAFEQAQQALAGHWGLTPGPGLKRMYERILAADPGLMPMERSEPPPTALGDPRDR